jgi:hypothetical protein
MRGSYRQKWKLATPVQGGKRHRHPGYSTNTCEICRRWQVEATELRRSTTFFGLSIQISESINILAAWHTGIYAKTSFSGYSAYIVGKNFRLPERTD